MVYCMFEQSGTFKNEFKKRGLKAIDLDILNTFNQTDVVIDLFSEINKAYYDRKSIFDKITTNDIIIAFFPCIRFENQILLSFRGELHGMEEWDNVKKLEKDMKLQHELTDLYNLLSKLVIICYKRGFKLIIENPYSKQHYLTTHWCIKPDIIHYDRRTRGDYFKKPTQYWFINFSPKRNKVNYKVPIIHTDIKDAVRAHPNKVLEENGIKTTIKISRSMIHPNYAGLFIDEYIL